MLDKRFGKIPKVELLRFFHIPGKTGKLNCFPSKLRKITQGSKKHIVGHNVSLENLHAQTCLDMLSFIYLFFFLNFKYIEEIF